MLVFNVYIYFDFFVSVSGHLPKIEIGNPVFTVSDPLPSEFNISVQDTERALRKARVNKAAGPDNIQAWVLRDCRIPLRPHCRDIQQFPAGGRASCVREIGNSSSCAEETATAILLACLLARSRSLAHSLTHSLTHSLARSLAHSLTHSLTYLLTYLLTYVYTSDHLGHKCVCIFYTRITLSRAFSIMWKVLAVQVNSRTRDRSTNVEQI